jgi:hypothetical protein
MASLGQYQSFALIAYDALRIQNDKMCCLRDNGENVSEEVRLLFIARYMIDIVLYYSTGNLGVATPGYKAYTDIIGTPVTAVNAYGNWSGTITVFDASLTIVLTLSVPADILGNKDAVVDLWNSTHGDTGWIMSYEVAQYTMLPQNQSFRYVMSSPKGYTDYTGYSFEYIQYEGGVDAEQNSPLVFSASGLISLLPSSGKILFYYTAPPLYEDLTFVNYNTIQDIIDKVFETTGFTFTLIDFLGSPRILIKSPLNSFDYFNGLIFEFQYYVDPASPPLSPADFIEVFGFTSPIGVAPTQETYSASFSKSPIYPEQTEGEIISVCNWISNNLRFFTEPIPQLDSTTLNG